MSFRTLLSLAMTYSCVAITAITFLLILYVAGYHVIYRKLLKGQKKFPYAKTCWWICFLFYAIVVAGATILFRYPSAEPEPVYPLFFSYRDAWIAGSVISWRNIILNFCMFVPLGILLPIGVKNLRSFGKILLAGFGFSLMIELVQLISKRGMFEPDDLLGNTTGALIGYGLFLLGDQVILRIKKRPLHKKRTIFLAQLPLLLTILAFTVILASYHFMKLGVHPDTPLNTPSKKNLTVSSSIDFSDENTKAMVYYQKPLTSKEAVAKGNEILSRVGTSVSKDRSFLYENEAILYSEDHDYSLMISYRTGTYRLTSFPLIHTEADSSLPSPDAVIGATEAETKSRLKNAGIPLEAKESSFEEKENGWYCFTYKMVPSDDSYLYGTVECQCKEKGVSTIVYHLANCKVVKEYPILSEKEAYEQITRGDFSYWGDAKNAKLDFQVTGCELVYVNDSKGYYQPTYEFTGTINGESERVRIPALK